MFTIPRPSNRQKFREIWFFENIFFQEYFFWKTFFFKFENPFKMRSLAANRTSLRRKLTEISILLRRPFWRVFWPPNFYSLDYWCEIRHKYGLYNSTNSGIRIIIVTLIYLKWKIINWKFWKFHKIFFLPMKKCL